MEELFVYFIPFNPFWYGDISYFKDAKEGVPEYIFSPLSIILFCREILTKR